MKLEPAAVSEALTLRTEVSAMHVDISHTHSHLAELGHDGSRVDNLVALRVLEGLAPRESI